MSQKKCSSMIVLSRPHDTNEDLNDLYTKKAMASMVKFSQDYPGMLLIDNRDLNAK